MKELLFSSFNYDGRFCRSVCLSCLVSCTAFILEPPGEIESTAILMDVAPTPSDTWTWVETRWPFCGKMLTTLASVPELPLNLFICV